MKSQSSPLKGTLAAALLLAKPLLTIKYQFAFLIVSSFSSKILHLYTHRTSLPILLYLLYAPTFLLQDALLIIIGRTVLYRQNRNSIYSFRKLLGALVAGITAAASASQVSFYFETGGEIQWLAAESLAFDPQGFQLLLSGLPNFLVALSVFVCLAWLMTPGFYDGLDRLFGSFVNAVKKLRNTTCSKGKLYASLPSAESSAGDEEELLPKQKTPGLFKAFTTLASVLTVVIACTILQVVRPRSPPYAHMSGSLPFTVVESLFFSPVNTEFCLVRPFEPVVFPFDDIYSNATLPDHCAAGRHRHRPPHHPPPPYGGPNDLSPHHPPHPRHRNGRHSRPPLNREELYDPSCDPLSAQNEDQAILEPIVTAFENGKPAIKHVVLLSLESTRKDVFPLQKGNRVYEKIASLSADAHLLNTRLAKLTPTAEILTGEANGFGFSSDAHQSSPYQNWRSRLNETFGGINVKGVTTAGAYTLKSLLGSHCGVEPLPVDFTEELRGQIYQSCLPEILAKFNAPKAATPAIRDVGKKRRKIGPDYYSALWHSVYMQATTDQFDSQDRLNKRIGFDDIIVKSTLQDPSSKHYPPTLPESNYFGFPESELLPYLRDLFADAKSNNQRVFLSHLTSSTHHPFNTPESWSEHQDYLERGTFGSEDPFNRYLNTIKYQDEWLETFFSFLEEIGVLDETLVVLVGDHGLAFDTTDGSSSAVENGHVSNFEIPLLFLHPQLPRVQLNASTTQLSIVPTILDILVQTNSLSDDHSKIASGLLPHYQGQSLIRTFLPSQHGKRLWHFGVINPGGSMMVISSSETSFRLIMPLCSTTTFKFTDVSNDPGEERPVEEWEIDALAKKVKEMHGEEGEKWVRQAEKLARWWFWEQRERWDYHGAARGTDRSPEMGEGGQIKKEHWWETK